VTKTAEVERGSGECKAQLSGVTDGDANPYYVNGDWHDVFYQPAQVEAEYAYFSVDNHQARVMTLRKNGPTHELITWEEECGYGQIR
jgi:hypothetical protein